VITPLLMLSLDLQGTPKELRQHARAITGTNRTTWRGGGREKGGRSRHGGGGWRGLAAGASGGGAGAAGVDRAQRLAGLRPARASASGRGSEARARTRGLVRVRRRLRQRRAARAGAGRAGRQARRAQPRRASCVRSRRHDCRAGSSPEGGAMLTGTRATCAGTAGTARGRGRGRGRASRPHARSAASAVCCKHCKRSWRQFAAARPARRQPVARTNTGTPCSAATWSSSRRGS